MKSRLTSLTAITLSAALAMPVHLAAQGSPKEKSKEYHHYHLVDLGTLGGPNSFIPFGETRTTNSRGQVIVEADTPIPDPYAPYCFQPQFGGCLVDHTMLWENGFATDLGALPGVNGSFPIWINSRGGVAGFSENGARDPLTGAPEFIAVFWKDGQIFNLGTLGGASSEATAINDRDQVVGGALNTTLDPYSATFPQSYCGSNPCLFATFPFFLFPPATQVHAVLWQNGVAKDLGTLGGPDSVALFINQAGEIAGQSYINSTPNPTTGVPTVDPFFIGKDGKMQDIPNSFGGTASYLADFNNRGQIAGEFTLAGDLTSHPFLWDRGVVTDLGTFGADCGLPFAINDAGEVAGWACSQSGAVFAFLWRKNTLTNLGTVDGDSCSTGNALNAQGQVVGESSPQCSFFDGDVRAFLWQKGSPIVDLNTLIAPGSPLYLLHGDSINDRGEIAADSIMSNGDHHAVLLIPCDDDHSNVEGCDYSMVDATATVTQTSPAVRNASSGTPPQSLMRRMNRYRFPGRAFGPRN